MRSRKAPTATTTTTKVTQPKQSPHRYTGPLIAAAVVLFFLVKLAVVFSNYDEGTGFCYEDGVWLGLRGSIAGNCEGKAAPQASIFSPAISLSFHIPLTRSAKRRRGPAREY